MLGSSKNYLLVAGLSALLGGGLATWHIDTRRVKEENALLKTQAEQRIEAERRLADALAERDAARDAIALGATEYDRVRRQLDRASALAVNADRAADARCRSLLGEGLGLLQEGRSLLIKHAADHDAVMKSVGKSR